MESKKISGSENNKYKIGIRGAWVGIIVNLSLSIVKFWAGFAGNSNALVVDAIHTASDIFSSIVVLIGMKIGLLPADAQHPYGHGRAESIAGKTVAILLIVVGANLIWNSALNILSGQLQVPEVFTLWIVVLSIVVKEILFRYKAYWGKKINSSSLLADAWHHRSDALSSVAVLVGIGGAIIGGIKWSFLDQAAAIVVSIFILKIGLKIFKETAMELMDSMPDAQIIEKIKELARKIKGVKDVETLRARKSGLGLLVDIHVEVEKTMTVEESHTIAKKVKEKITSEMDEVKEVLVHIEPYYPNDH